jgi:uncharacterized membrane protein
MSLPPIHPALVHLPIAFVVLSFAADFIAKMTRRDSLRLLGFWAMLAALLSGLFTIAAGYWDLSRATLSPESQQFVELHLKIGWAIGAALVVLTIWRWRIRQQARRVVTAPYLAASFVLLSMTTFQGWYGGEMVYSHGAGVAAAGQGTEPAARSQQRLVRVHDALLPGTAIGRPAPSFETERGSNQFRQNNSVKR